MPVNPDALPINNSADNVSGILIRSEYFPEIATGAKSSVFV